MFNLQFDSKGITPIISAITIILIVISMSFLFLHWGSDTSDTFKETTEERTESEIKTAKTRFSIIDISGKELALKNKGEDILNTSEFAFYLNDTSFSSDPITPSSISPGEVIVVRISSAPENLSEYNLRVSGPHGKYDEISLYSSSTTSTSTSIVTTISTTSTTTSISTTVSTTSTTSISTTTSVSTTTTSTTTSVSTTISTTSTTVVTTSTVTTCDQACALQSDCYSGSCLPLAAPSCSSTGGCSSGDCGLPAGYDCGTLRCICHPSTTTSTSTTVPTTASTTSTSTSTTTSIATCPISSSTCTSPDGSLICSSTGSSVSGCLNEYDWKYYSITGSGGCNVRVLLTNSGSGCNANDLWIFDSSCTSIYASNTDQWTVGWSGTPSSDIIVAIDGDSSNTDCQWTIDTRCDCASTTSTSIPTTSTSTTTPTTASTATTTSTSIPTTSTSTTTPTTASTATTTSTSTSTTIVSTLTLTPSSGYPSYTVNADANPDSSNICDWNGCSGSSCTGILIRVGDGTFSAPSAAGTYGYYACPGNGFDSITVVSSTSTSTSTSTSIPPTTSTSTSTSTSIPTTSTSTSTSTSIPPTTSTSTTVSSTSTSTSTSIPPTTSTSTSTSTTVGETCEEYCANQGYWDDIPGCCDSDCQTGGMCPDIYGTPYCCWGVDTSYHASDCIGSETCWCTERQFCEDPAWCSDCGIRFCGSYDNCYDCLDNCCEWCGGSAITKCKFIDGCYWSTCIPASSCIFDIGNC